MTNTTTIAPRTNNAPMTPDRERLLRDLVMKGASRDQVDLVLSVCNRYGFDALLKHVVLISGGLYVTRDGLLDNAHRSGRFDGISVTAERDGDGNWTATATVWVKDMGHPVQYTAYQPEHQNQQSPAWKKAPRAMTVKCAEVMALKRAFNISLGTAEEIGHDDSDEAFVALEGPVRAQNTPMASQPTQQAFNREAMRGQPQTQPQRRRLHAIANESGWSLDQLHGRAGEINPDARETLDALDKAEISELMDAVANEQPWVDPRQQRFIDANGVIQDDPDDEWTPPQVTGVFENDVRILMDCARAAESTEELAHLWRFARSLQLSADPEVKGLFTQRRRELKPDYVTA